MESYFIHDESIYSIRAFYDAKVHKILRLSVCPYIPRDRTMIYLADEELCDQESYSTLSRHCPRNPILLTFCPMYSKRNAPRPEEWGASPSRATWTPFG